MLGPWAHVVILDNGGPKIKVNSILSAYIMHLIHDDHKKVTHSDNSKVISCSQLYTLRLIVQHESIFFNHSVDIFIFSVDIVNKKANKAIILFCGGP